MDSVHNVPGAFSSGTPAGEDFRIVLEEICRVKDGGLSVPRPPGGAWEPAGCILGEEFSLAWRVFDAQYWPGTPQRRRRIYLVADFAGHSAPQILFEQERLFGDPAQGGGEGEDTAAPTGAGVANPSGNCLTPWDVQSRRMYTPEVAWPTLYSGGGGAHGYVATAAFACNQRDEVRDLHDVAGALCTTQSIKQQTLLAKTGMLTAGGNEVTSTIYAGYGTRWNGNAGCYSGDHFVLQPPHQDVLCLNDQGGQRMDVSKDISGTLRAQMSSHQPLVFENHGIDARYTGPLPVAPTISARYGTGGNNVPLALDESYCISGNILGRQVNNGGNHMGFQSDIAYTLTATDHHAVYSRQRVDVFQENDVASTQSARQYKDATDLVCGSNQLIRRLTPLECERLQGFPDLWTEVLGCSDSARYKAIGNSVAIPCVSYVLHGIAYFLRGQYMSPKEV